MVNDAVVFPAPLHPAITKRFFASIHTNLTYLRLILEFNMIKTTLSVSLVSNLAETMYFSAFCFSF